MSLVAYGRGSNGIKFNFLSLVIVATKAFDVIIEMQPLSNLGQSLKKSFGKLKQMLNVPSQVCKHNLNN